MVKVDVAGGHRRGAIVEQFPAKGKLKLALVKVNENEFPGGTQEAAVTYTKNAGMMTVQTGQAADRGSQDVPRHAGWKGRRADAGTALSEHA